MARPSNIKPAQIGLGAAVVATLLTLGAGVVAMLAGYRLEALVIIAACTQLLALGALWFAYRASMRVQRLTNVQYREMRDLKKGTAQLQDELAALREKEEGWHDLTRKRIREKHSSLQNREMRDLKKGTAQLRAELAALREREEGWHELTRKRIREKHNSLQRTAKKNVALHELTRKRLREKHGTMYKLVSGRTEKLEKLQNQVEARLKEYPSAERAEADVPQRNQLAVRNAIFALLEQNKK